MGKKPSGPSAKQQAADAENQRINREMLKLAQKQAAGVEMPVVPQTLPAAPPPTSSSADVQRAADDARIQASKRNGLRKTILTGDTGGYKAPSTMGGGQTLLG